MSRSYKTNDPDVAHFITFAVVEWVDVFTRKQYRDILIDSIQYCQKEKGFLLYAWCIMSNHVHMIGRAKDKYLLSDILRDMKKFTSKKIIKAIQESTVESRQEWMLNMFSKAGETNSQNKSWQFWRQDNKPIELYTNAVIDQKVNYIHNNPVEAGIVERPEDFCMAVLNHLPERKDYLILSRYDKTLKSHCPRVANSRVRGGIIFF